MEQRTVEIEGIEFTIDTSKLGTWRSFNIVKKAYAANDDYQRIDSLIEIACYITDLTEQELIEKCGGDEVSLERVVTVVSQLIAETYPKK